MSVFDASEAQYLRYARAAAGGMRPGGAQDGTPVQLRLLDEADFSHEGRHRLRGQRLRRAQRHHPRPCRGAEPRPVPDAGQLRPAAALRAGDAPALLVPDAAVLADQVGRHGADGDAGRHGGAAPVQLGPLVDGLRVVRAGLDAGGPRDHRRPAPRPRPGARVTAEQGRIGPSPLASAAAVTAQPALPARRAHA